METADTLKFKLGCKTDTELGQLFGRGDKAVSAWRAKGLPAAIQIKASEMLSERGIISEPLTPYSAATDEKSLSKIYRERLLSQFPEEVREQLEEDIVRLILERKKEYQSRPE